MEKRLLPVLLLCTVLACTPGEPVLMDKYVTFFYNQTACADAWPTAQTDSETLANLSAYLVANNLYVGSMDIRHDGTTEICYACSCKTGKVIYVTTLDSDKMRESYQELRFELLKQ